MEGANRYEQPVAGHFGQHGGRFVAETLMHDDFPRGPNESVVTSLRSRTMDALDRIHQEYLGRDDVYQRQPILRAAPHAQPLRKSPLT